MLVELNSLKTVAQTIEKLSVPMLHFFGIMMTDFYFFALLGMLFFGGNIQKDGNLITKTNSIPNNYHLLNFNDLLSSFVTLFCVPNINFIILSKMQGDTTIARLFFSFQFFLHQLILFNIVCAFAIDMYSSV